MKMQRSKLWGLKKLRKITQGMPGIAAFAPFKVYENPEQFRIAHAQGKPRLLIRTDEKGRTYRHLSWEAMPREDASISEIGRYFGRLAQRRIRRRMEKMRKKLPKRTGKAIFIVHPTKPREEVFLTGRIACETLFGEKLVEFAFGFGSSKEKRFFSTSTAYTLFLKTEN